MDNLEEVHAGQDGWLFLNGGANQPIRFYTEENFLTLRHLNGWIERIENRGKSVQKLGAKYVHLFAPDKISIYGDFYGKNLPFFDLRPNKVIHRALEKARLADFFLDAELSLHRARQSALTYWKTDTHWTAEGTYSVYQSLCERLNVAPAFDLSERPSKESSSFGDLGNKLTPPVRETMRRYQIMQNAHRIYANALVEEGEKKEAHFPGGLLSGSHVVYRNESSRAHKATLMLFGDSYSEVRPSNGLMTLLAETFQELHFFWSNSVDLRQVEKVRPDFVVSELAERFARVLPDDPRDIEIYAAERLSKHLETNR